MTLTDREWRDLVKEKALDPNLPIVDAHHHVWDEAPLPGIEPFGLERFLQEKAQSAHNIVATVSVDCRTNYRKDGPERLRILGETEYVAAVAEEADRRGGRFAGGCAAIVPTADLLEGAAVGEILDAHTMISDRVRGIRYMTAYHEKLPAPTGRQPGMMTRTDFREGFSELAKRDMVFDAWVFQHQMGEVIDLAKAFPRARIILDQLGGPLGGALLGRDIATSFAEWRDAIQAVAACENVVVKIGGLNMHFAGVSAIGFERPRTSAETADAHRNYILAAIEAFGPSRSMFVSNFPVDMKGISYDVLWNSFKIVTDAFSADERHEMFAGVAARTYRIDISGLAKVNSGSDDLHAD